jgi:hypothetical protein
VLTVISSGAATTKRWGADAAAFVGLLGTNCSNKEVGKAVAMGAAEHVSPACVAYCADGDSALLSRDSLLLLLLLLHSA